MWVRAAAFGDRGIGGISCEDEPIAVRMEGRARERLDIKIRHEQCIGLGKAADVDLIEPRLIRLMGSVVTGLSLPRVSGVPSSSTPEPNRRKLLSVHPPKSTTTTHPKLLDLSDRVLDLHLQNPLAE